MAKRALLVGVDTYPDARNKLNSSVADTQRFRGSLENYYGFDDSILVSDDPRFSDRCRVRRSDPL
jgi:Caspase domain